MKTSARGSWSSLPQQLRVAGIALLAAWVTVLSWRLLTANFAEVGFPLLFIGVVVAGLGALARWSRIHPAAIVAGQVVLGGLLVLGTTTGSPFPTPGNVDAFMAALDAALESSRNYAAPVQAGVPPVHPLLLIGGTLVVIVVDVIACTLRRAPVAGLALLALAALYNAWLGGYHAGVEWKFWQGPTDCSGSVVDLGSAGTLLERLDTVKVIRCDDVQWRFLGLSLAGYNVLISLAMAAIAAWGIKSVKR